MLYPLLILKTEGWMKFYRAMMAIGLIIILLAFLMLILSGCITNSFEGEHKVKSEIIKTHGGSLLVKYKLGNSILYDQIQVDNIALLSDIANKKTLNMRVIINAADCCPQTGSIVYYIGASKLGISQVYNHYNLVYDIVKNQPEIVTWKVIDGKVIKSDKSKSDKPKINELSKKGGGTL